MKVFTLLQKIAKDEMTFADETFKVEWQQINREIDQQYSLFCYIDLLLKKIHKLEKTLKVIHKSTSWKLLGGVRKIDDLIRGYRRKARSAKKINKAYG
jgi:hypothetical protein